MKVNIPKEYPAIQEESKSLERTASSTPDMVGTKQIITGEVDEAKQQKEAEAKKRAEELLALSKQFTYSSRKGEYRCPTANNAWGGFQLTDPEATSRMRGAVSEFVKALGKKMYAGDFNLTRTSFPIKCMASKSQLEFQSWQQSVMSIYFNYAATEVTDPLERLKLFLAANIAQSYYDALIEKPLNPVLGETYHTVGQDGAKIYVEQTSHHPPRSHWYIDGPQGNYIVTGHGAFDVKAGPRMANIIISGHKKVVFKDGQTIKCDLSDNLLYNIFVGTIGFQTIGKQTFEDEGNGLTGFIKYGAYTMKKQDFIWGEIFKDGKKVCTIEGNYMGYMDFDKKRYWDLRDEETFPKHFRPAEEVPDVLPSDSTKR